MFILQKELIIKVTRWDKTTTSTYWGCHIYIYIIYLNQITIFHNVVISFNHTLCIEYG